MNNRRLAHSNKNTEFTRDTRQCITKAKSVKMLIIVDKSFGAKIVRSVHAGPSMKHDAVRRL